MDITRYNFNDEFDKIAYNLKRSCFVAFDAEFTAILSKECFKHRLFDTNEERYNKIKNEVSKMIMTQIGLTMFQYDRDRDTYNAIGYTFHLCPQAFGSTDQSFIFQASTLNFLCKHNFDFNKFMYKGIPYLSKYEEIRIRQLLENGTVINDILSTMDMDDEKQLQKHCSEVALWLTNSEEDTIYLDVDNNIMRFVVHNEIRQRFPGVLTTNSLGNSKKILIYRNKNVEGATNAPQSILEENLMNHILGFSKVILLLEEYRKPIIGHNLFLDIVLLHSQFIGPLPASYTVFKSNVHSLLPEVYDTKYISHEMKRKLTFDEVWKSNALQDLYEFFSERKCKKLEIGVNQIRISTPFNNNQSYHEAGWDSYCSGYCFIRLGHWAACAISGSFRPVGPTEKLTALALYCNRVNVIRAAVAYMNLTEPDPASHRPKLLHVKALSERNINVANITSILATFGSVDVQVQGSRTALVATSTNYAYDNILKQFKDSRDYRFSKYSVLRHSNLGKLTIWSSAIVGGGLAVMMFLNK